MCRSVRVRMHEDDKLSLRAAPQAFPSEISKNTLNGTHAHTHTPPPPPPPPQRVNVLMLVRCRGVNQYGDGSVRRYVQ